MTDYSRSMIRTIVPLVVGSVVGWLAARGVDIDQAAVIPAVDAVVAAVYYAAARGLEARWPQLGWLLGAPGAPSYSVAAPIEAEVAQAPVFVAEPSTDIPDLLRPTDEA